MYQTIVEAALAHGAEQPDHLAVAFRKEQLTYAQLAGQIRAMAQVLSEDYGVGRGDFVMLPGVSKPEYIVGWLAIQLLGAVSIPTDKSAKLESILDVYQYAGPKLLLSDGRELPGEVNAVPLKTAYAEAAKRGDAPEMALCQGRSDDDVSEILFTTGTTGKPKGVMLSVGNLYASTHNTWKGVGMEPEDRVLIPLPLNHSIGMRVLRATLYIGASVILQNGFTFAKELENNILNYRCTGLVSVPASMEVVYRQMQDRFPEIMGNLRYMEVGAGSLSYDMKKKLLAALPHTKVVNTWGSTETGGAIFLDLTAHPDKLTSIGHPVKEVEFKVVDGAGRQIEARDIDTAGRMALKGPMQMKGYYHMPEVTAETLVDGWLYTNDIVYQDEDGFVYMLGRADDIINVGGEKVSPIEVENVACEYEKIRECACIGVEDPDGILGSVPVLYVVPEDGSFDGDEATKYLSVRLEKYKLPHRYIQIGELPRNRMKKLDRRALHRMWEEMGEEELLNPSIQNILSRRSVREFTEREIPKPELEMILKCGIYAPSGHNMQTWRFTVLRGKERLARFKELVGKAAKEQGVYFYGFNSPDTVILVSNDRRNGNSIQDSACAAENMMLAANSYGIGSVWINALCSLSDVPEVREALKGLGIPDTHIVWAAVAMGYPEKPGKLLAKKMNVVSWAE